MRGSHGGGDEGSARSDRSAGDRGSRASRPNSGAMTGVSVTAAGWTECRVSLAWSFLPTR
jgi:hypothetical protein